MIIFLLICAALAWAIVAVCRFSKKQEQQEPFVPYGEKVLAEKAVELTNYYPAYSYDDVKFYPPRDIVKDIPKSVFTPGARITLQPESFNPADDRAIAMYVGGYKIGYVLRGTIQDMIHDYLDQGLPVLAHLEKFSYYSGDYHGKYTIQFFRKHTASGTFVKRRSYGDIDIRTIVPSNPDAVPATPVTGKKIVFAGFFEMPIEEMMQIAVDSGAVLRKAVTKTVDYLVVGNFDNTIVDENGLTGKEITAAKLNKEGANIQVLTAARFLDLVGYTPKQ